MKSILDQEMPVSRRSRRILFFWWTTVAVVVISSVGLFLMKENNLAPAIIPVEQPASPLKNDIKTTSPSATEAMASAVPTQHTSTSSSAELPIDHNSKANIPSTVQKSISNQDKFLAENSIIGITDNDKAQINASTSNTQTNESSGLAAPLTEVNVGIQVQNVLRVNSKVPSIQSLQTTNIPLEESYYTINAIEPAKSKRMVPPLEPDISASGLIGQDGGVGVYGGAGLSVNLSHKFSITTNLGYSVFRPDATIFGSDHADLAAAPESNPILVHDSFYSGINTYIEASNVNADAGSNEIESLVESVNQWQVGAGVKWKFSRRFFTEAGVQIGFNTKVTSEYPIIDGDPQTGIVQGRIGNSFNSYDVVRSTMTSIYAGAGYRFGQHLDAFIQWKHGLDTYLLNDNSSIPSADLGSGERSDYIRGLNLGLRYVL